MLVAALCPPTPPPPPLPPPPYPLHIVFFVLFCLPHFFYRGAPPIPPPTTAPLPLAQSLKNKKKKKAAILDFTDVKNVTKGRGGKEGTRLSFYPRPPSVAAWVNRWTFSPPSLSSNLYFVSGH